MTPKTIYFDMTVEEILACITAITIAVAVSPGMEKETYATLTNLADRMTKEIAK